MPGVRAPPTSAAAIWAPTTSPSGSATCTRQTEPRKLTASTRAVAPASGAKPHRLGADERDDRARRWRIRRGAARASRGLDGSAVGDAPEPVREADELGDEGGPGALVELGRGRDLLEPPGRHDADPIAERERLLLVVGHEQGRRADADLDAPDLLAQLAADLGVERRERFVEQEDLGLDRQRASQRDALLLAAGELVRVVAPVTCRGRRARAARPTRRRRSAASTPRSRSP